MYIPVTRTKIVLPRRRADLLTRQRLIDLMVELTDYKLIILAAPAGYGKTSMLVDFASQTNMPVCWYALDTLDREPLRFITHLIASIAQRFPNFGTQSFAALDTANPSKPDFNQIVTAIVNDAYDNIQEHFLLVLDDYHLVNETREIDDIINRFIQDVAENCHLVLSSRSLLSLPDLPILVARSQVGGLGFEELIFHPTELKALVQQNYHVQLDDAMAEELAHETEGWITGFLLSAQTMWKGLVNQIRVARVSGVSLYDYLAQQVLENQPNHIRNFLLRTSLLEEFDAELCTAVLGADCNCASNIAAVLQNNLFVMPVGEDGQWIRYHHLFRDFLQSRLQTEDPHAREDILHRLAEVQTRRQEWEQAYYALQKLGDVAAQADLIDQCGSELIKSGRNILLGEWLDRLPSEHFNLRPNLLSLRGTVAIQQGQDAFGYELLDRAEAAFRQSDDLPQLARTLARRSISNRFFGRYTAALSDAQEALQISRNVPQLESVLAEALRAIGSIYNAMGRAHEALDFLERAKNAYQKLQDQQNVAMVLIDLGFTYTGSGDYKQALACFEEALEIWHSEHNAVGQANLLNNLGVLHHLLGNYVQAAKTFEEALAYASIAGLKRMQVYLYCSLGDLYSDLHALPSAQEAYQRAGGILTQVNDHFLNFYLNLVQASLSRKRNALGQAQRYLDQAKYLILENESDSQWGLWYYESGQLSLKLSEPEEAITYLEKAAQVFNRGGQIVEAARSYMLLAAAHDQAGEAQSARKALQKAFTTAATLDSQHVLILTAQETRTFLEKYDQDKELGSQVAQILARLEQLETELPGLRRRMRPHLATIPFGPAKLTMHAFGASQVELDGKPVTTPEWISQKRVRELFFYIVAHPEGLSKETIGVVFWPESTPAQLKLQFKNAIYRMRYALGQDVIEFENDRYRFNRNLDYEYDVENFANYLRRAENSPDREQKIKRLEQAASVYQHPYLLDVDGSWVIPIREALWREYTTTVSSLAHLYLESNDNDKVLEASQKLLAIDPCLEEAHRLAMRAYAAKGDRAGLVRQFERCQQALQDEIDAPPSPQTITLFRNLNH
jgi:ATP/maltotriose-dependent transcriptional regulator MalT/DNA-binding SARP family transcriptional activator